MIDKVSQVETLSRVCDGAPATAVPATVLSRTRTFYDQYVNEASFGDAPTKGDVVRTEDLDSTATATTPVYVRTTSNGYDANGRVTSATDARGYTTTTAYTTANGGLVTGPSRRTRSATRSTTVKEPAWDLPDQDHRPERRGHRTRPTTPSASSPRCGCPAGPAPQPRAPEVQLPAAQDRRPDRGHHRDPAQHRRGVQEVDQPLRRVPAAAANPDPGHQAAAGSSPTPSTTPSARSSGSPRPYYDNTNTAARHRPRRPAGPDPRHHRNRLRRRRPRDREDLHSARRGEVAHHHRLRR